MRTENTKIEVNHAIRFISQAWKIVKQESIINCWVYVGLLNRIDEESFTQDENYEINNDIYNKCNIDIDDRLTLEEFTSVDDISEIFELDSITEIIDSLTNNNKDSDDTQEAGFDPPPSSEKEIQGFESLTAYFECYSKYSNDIHLLNLLSKRLDILCINNKKQTTLSFINNSK